MTAVLDCTPQTVYGELEKHLGRALYQLCMDTPASPAHKTAFKAAPRRAGHDQRAGRRAHEESQPIGGIKVTAANSWFAARLSGIKDSYKIYAESFIGPEHMARNQADTPVLVSTAFNSAVA
jgi:phosphoglucomutase